MIEYDYTLERDYRDEKRTFRPGGIPKQLENLAYIEGPNSCGKSTLLNILALGFHGLKKEHINPALRNKMNDLLNSNHQRLKFSFQITDKDGKLLLSSSKNSFDQKEIVVKEYVDGRENTLVADAFHRKYNLIYDIPDNPTDRLNQLVYEIRETQRMYYNRLGGLRNYVRAAINEIKGGRDPDRIASLTKSVEALNKEVEQMTQEIRLKEESLDLIERYTFSRLYVSAAEEKRSLEEKIQDIENRAKRSQRQQRKASNEYQSQMRTVKTLVEDMEEKKKKVSGMLAQILSKEDAHHLKVWDKIDLRMCYEDFEIPETLDSEALALQRIVFEMAKEDTDLNDLEQANVLSDLIEFLEHYRNTDVILPGIEKTVDEFLSVLEETYEKFKAIKIRSDNLQELLKDLQDLRNSRAFTNKELIELKKIKDSQGANGAGEVEEVIDPREMEKLRNRLRSISDICENYMLEMRKKHVKEADIIREMAEVEQANAVEPYRVYTGQQLKELVNSLRQQLVTANNALKSKRTTLSLHSNELRRLERMEKHRYQDRLGDLEAILARIQRLEDLLRNEYDRYISAVIDRKSGDDEGEKEYLEEVARYLGRKVGYIRHIDNEYKVSKIDLVAGDIVTESGKHIRLSDMGTGQGGAAYLLGLLNTDDSRPILALFDEVAMMDEKSMQPIYDKFRDLYGRRRLLVGIVVQKGEAIKVVPKG
jgi:exonuclease SbcC